jgi:dienelactone hydrolase
MRSRRVTAVAAIAVSALSMLVAACTTPSRSAAPVAGPAVAAAEGTQKGPDPTEASITGRGPFTVAQTAVAAGNGFGGGTIFYPNATDQGTFGAVVVMPGFLNAGSVMNPYGNRWASQGFVVLVANTNTVLDFPAQRATEQLAAIDWLTSRSPAASRVDPARVAVAGYSMGGGGTLESAKRRPTIKAAVPMAPWDLGASFAGVRVPTMVVACSGDSVATPSTMARPYYAALAGPKAYFEVSAGNHACPLLSAQAIGTRAIPWLKRFVDDDTRYDRFICPTPINAAGTTGWKSTCPF